MSTPETGLKTLAIRLDPAIHAQLSFIAQLRGQTINDEGIKAIIDHVQRAKNDPELRAKADSAQKEIEREAAVKNAAIASIFTAPGPATPAKRTRTAE